MSVKQSVVDQSGISYFSGNQNNGAAIGLTGFGQQRFAVGNGKIIKNNARGAADHLSGCVLEISIVIVVVVVFNVSERFAEYQRMLAVGGTKMDIARAHGQTVFFPYNRAGNDLYGQLEMGHHVFNHEYLLVIFLTEEGEVGLY